MTILTPLDEQRLVTAHKDGVRDYQDGRELGAPTYNTQDERDAYRAGYLGARRRANGAKL